MERARLPLLNPRFEQGPRTVEQVLLVAPALEHRLAEHELARQPWRCLPCRLHLDYCREQCCWMMKMTMTWGLGPNRPKFSQSMALHSGYEGHGDLQGPPP